MRNFRSVPWWVASAGFPGNLRFSRFRPGLGTRETPPPKAAHNRQKRVPVPPWGTAQGRAAATDGQSTLGNIRVCFWPCSDPFGPKAVSVGPTKGLFGP